MICQGNQFSPNFPLNKLTGENERHWMPFGIIALSPLAPRMIKNFLWPLKKDFFIA
jgi:hypothetical protein